MEAKITQLRKEDLNTFINLIRVFEEVFEMKDFAIPNPKHLQLLLKSKSFLVFVAQVGENVIGGLTAYVLDQYYSTKPLAYIYDVAVLPVFQRKGIGKKMIDTVTMYCRENGFEEVFVQADKVDAHAIDFYRSTPITEEESMVHFYYSI